MAKHPNSLLIAHFIVFDRIHQPEDIRSQQRTLTVGTVTTQPGRIEGPHVRNGASQRLGKTGELYPITVLHTQDNNTVR